MDEIIPDYGSSKVRVGVKLADGSYAPGASAENTTITITRTGPSVPGGEDVTSCVANIPSGATGWVCVASLTVGADELITISQSSANPGLTILEGTKTTARQCPEPAMGCVSGDAFLINTGIPPLAVDDTASTDQGESVDIDVTANDDLVGASLTGLTVVAGPAHGTAVVIGDGADQKVRYTPESGYSGADGFTYSIATAGGSATGSVAITVDPVAPLAVDDTASTDQGESVDIDVTANDDLIGASLTGLTVKADPAHGTATVVGSGANQKIRYTPKPGYTGTDGFTYSIATASGSATASVNITVNPGPPVGAKDDSETESKVAGAMPDAGGEDPALLAAATAMILAGAVLVGGARRFRKLIR